MPDLSAYELIFKDDFESELNAYRGSTGLWSTSPRRNDLMTNGPRTVFLSDVTTTQDEALIGINPLIVDGGMLHIKSGVIPSEDLQNVRTALEGVGRATAAGDVRYYTGMVSTADTWAQAYGYYEITAEIPVGRGHWPAFWLAPAGIGWPPEIDIFEAYGKAIDGTLHPRNNTFSTAVYFDHIDIEGQHNQSVDLRNPFVLGEDGEPSKPILRENNGGQQYVFQSHINTSLQFDVDLYSGAWTWAAEWTPDFVAFYFGKDPSSLIEIFRTPTPDDLTTPMYTIINNQIGSRWGWNPVEGLDHLTFQSGNDFRVHSVSVHALRPENLIEADRRGSIIIDGIDSSQIYDSIGDDIIVTGGGAGQDFISLVGGQDIVHFDRGTGNCIITGLEHEDRIVLEGFYFDGPTEVLARLTQVDGDVWLTNGAYPSDPQTMIFRDSVVSDFKSEQFVVRWSVTPDVWSSLSRDPGWIGDDDGDGMVQAGLLGDRLVDAQSTSNVSATLIGGAGGDRFRVYRSDTVILEEPGQGIDTVETVRNFTLPDNVENISALPSAQGVEMVGNSGGNRLEGNLNSNSLRGGRGQDLIITKDGADLIGHAHGDGHDVIVGFTSDDRVLLEGYLLDGWMDLVPRLSQQGTNVRLDLGSGGSLTFQNISLSVFKEENFYIAPGGAMPWGNPVADPYARPGLPSKHADPDDLLPYPPTSQSALSIEGSSRNDTLRGTGLDEVLFGLDGEDLLRGFGGNDWLDGGRGTNHLNGGTGNDTLVAQGATDRLFGAEGADVFVLTRGSRGTLIMDYDAEDHINIAPFAESTENVRLERAGNWYKILIEAPRIWDEIGRVRTADPDDLWDSFLFS